MVVGHLPLPPHIPPFPPNKQSPRRGHGSFIPNSFSFFVGGGGGTYPSSANMGSRQSLVLRSVRFAVVLGALQLHLQPLHSDLEAVHRLDGCLCRHWIVIADEACRGRKPRGERVRNRLTESNSVPARWADVRTGWLTVFIWGQLHRTRVIIKAGYRGAAAVQGFWIIWY